MKRQYLSSIVIFLALGISALLTNIFLFKQPVRVQSQLAENIPQVIGSWQSVWQGVPTQAEYDGLETSDIIKRVYSDRKHSVHLVVAYIARSNRKSAHAQEACLRGSGAYVCNIEKVHMLMGSVQATSIEIDHQNQGHLVYYWYKIGRTYTSEYLKSSLKMFLGGLVGSKNQGAALIRISTPFEKGMEKQAKTRLEDFTHFLLPELERHLP